MSNFGEKVTIADVINPGKRAMAIRVNDVSGVAGFVTPGDRVDVLMTRRLDNDDMITTTVLQDIVVRGTDQLADEDQDKPSVARTITAEVSPEEAQRLALAQQAGTLSLTLRNLATTDQPELRSLSVNELSSTTVQVHDRAAGADRHHHPGRRALGGRRPRRLTETRPAPVQHELERSMSPFTVRCLGALAANVALSASSLHAQEQPAGPRALVPTAPSAAARCPEVAGPPGQRRPALASSWCPSTSRR